MSQTKVTQGELLVRSCVHYLVARLKGTFEPVMLNAQSINTFIENANRVIEKGEQIVQSSPRILVGQYNEVLLSYSITVELTDALTIRFRFKLLNKDTMERIKKALGSQSVLNCANSPTFAIVVPTDEIEKYA